VATYTHSTGKIGVMVELLCETDFVARNEEFVKVAKDICLQVASMNPKKVKDLMEMEFIKDPDKKVKDLVTGLVAKFGENIKIGRFERFEI
jgi:elongation factor Ts